MESISMNKFFSQINWPLVLGAIVIFELLSFLAFFFTDLNYIFLILTFIATAIIAWRSLEWGILLILIELIIGSHGHMFSIDILSFSLSVRMSIWLAVMLVFFVKLIIQRQSLIAIIKKIPYLKFYILLAFFIAFSLINAFFLGNDLSNILANFNTWLFFLLILPISYVYCVKDKQRLERLKSIFFLATLWLSLKTLFLVVFFSYDIAILPDLYRWLRVTGVAEVTTMADTWPRIFLQSHIFSSIAFLILVFKRDFASRWNIKEMLFAAVFLSTVIISFSRTFWLSMIIVFILFSAFTLIKTKKLKKIKHWFLKIFLIVILSFSFIYLANNILFLSSTSQFSLRNIRDRASYQEDEAAVASRWSLLPVLIDDIMKKPILGHGFGATVLYESSDPRVLQFHEDGWYETYAFEWGYLDLWHKLGLLGLIAYLSFLLSLLFYSFKYRFQYFLTPALLFLVIVHFFTPYLNHPLGIMIILLISCLLVKDKLL